MSGGGWGGPDLFALFAGEKDSNFRAHSKFLSLISNSKFEKYSRVKSGNFFLIGNYMKKNNVFHILYTYYKINIITGTLSVG